jgi:hypothetical protein
MTITYLVYVVLIGGDDWRVFGPRFVLVVLPFFAVVGTAGLTNLFDRPGRGLRLWMAIGAMACLTLVGGLSIFETAGYRGVIETMNRGWWTTARWLEAHAGPNDWIAVDAAGIIPYQTGLPTVDMLGRPHRTSTGGFAGQWAGRTRKVRL